MNQRIVLVTAVGGGGVGEQLVKSLRLAHQAYTIVGADADARSFGLMEVDVPVVLPLASSPEYVDQVLGVCARFGVRAIYPGSEPELLALSAARERIAGAGIVLFANSEAVIATGLDKARTAAALGKAGFRPPRSVLLSRPEDLDRVPFLPAVLKPNSAGGGSANVFVAQTDAEYKLFGAYLLEGGRSCLAQEYVGTSSDEYTVGVLSDLDGTFINSIALRRNILPAFSNRSRAPNRTGTSALGEQLVVSNGISQGDIGPFPAVTVACERIAAALDSRGPINIQCRLADGEVRVFEINPRFSGSASLRALVGFNEPDLLYRRHIEGERLTPRFAYRSGHIARGLREVLIDPALAGVAPGTGIFRWSTPPLPFIFRPLEAPDNPAGIPNSLPLTVSIDAATGRLCQLPDPAVADALTRAYAAGSEIPGLMTATGIGREYADDFLALLVEAGGAPRVDGLRVLEIGCGTGYLLSRLKELGGKVQGIEPGPQGQRGAGLHGVPVVEDTFPSSRITGEFDLIVLYLVLEHLPDPAEFLRSVRRQLAPSGRVALVVPDAEPFLAEGDASILFHEHYSYFTGATLTATLQVAGANRVAIRHSRLSRLLFALAGFGGAPADAEPSGPHRAASFALAHRFRNSASRTAAQLSAWLADARDRGESVGIYVPGRFANYVALGGIDPSGLRFFDDSDALQGHYFPGIPIAVESQDALVAHPTSRVLVMSASFGGRIKSRLEPLLPPATRITTLDELLR